MKCPRCGAEVKGQDVCGGCGKKFERPRGDIEVEYKDFKISEFLEIRSRNRRTGAGDTQGEETPRRDTEGEDGEGPDSPKGEEEECYNGQRVYGRKSFSLAVVTLLLLLAILAGIIFFRSLLAT
ncbi:MAG: hypothetical protein M1497_15125 [Nitrospirae bacterium]|nr:hypothetical protein [Nitrospirota bacterium]